MPAASSAGNGAADEPSRTASGSWRGRAAPDRRRRVGRAALGREPRERAVRSRFPPRAAGSPRESDGRVSWPAARARARRSRTAAARWGCTGAAAMLTAGITLQARDHGGRGRVAAAFCSTRRRAPRSAPSPRCDQSREAGPVERRVVAAVAAHRARVVAEQDHRRGGVGGVGQHVPARAGTVRGDVGEQRLGHAQRVRVDAERTDRAGGAWARRPGNVPSTGESQVVAAYAAGATSSRQSVSAIAGRCQVEQRRS